MIVGTAGHIDHGKTSLVRALTGVDTDRLKEEKARGITIDLGFAYLPMANGAVIGFVDVPGHEKFVHNMLAGATGIDFLLLIVAADDGVMPQTREHLAIADLLGIGRGVVALTKCDLVDDLRIEEAADEVRALLAGTWLRDIDIVPVSATTGTGIDALCAALTTAAVAIADRRSGALFRLAVDRVFTLQGTGTVVTGTVLSGSVGVGDQIVVSPSGLAARVRGIHAQNRQAERGVAGERCALNLAGDGVSKDAIRRGDMVLRPSLHAPTDRIDAVLRVLGSETRSVDQWMPVRFHHAASEVGARIVLLRDDPIGPGEEGLVQLVLESPIAAACGDRFVIRDTTAQRTIGGGRLINLRAPARKRRTPERLAQLKAQAMTDDAEALAALLAVAPFHVALTPFARDRALDMEAVTALCDEIGCVSLASATGPVVMMQSRWDDLRTSIIEALGAFHTDNPDLSGMGFERLRLAVAPWLPAPIARAGLQYAVRSGDIALDGAWVRLAGHVVRLTDADERLWSRMQGLIGGEDRFRPPRVRDIAGLIDVAESDVRRLLKLASRLGWADEVAHDHFFLRGTVAEMVDIAHMLAAHGTTGSFSAAAFRDQLNNGRKVAIQILEFFDRHGVTLRRGDERRINKHRLDLFSGPDRGESAKVQSADIERGREASPVGRPDFKSGRGREPVPGGFDSHSLPPISQAVSRGT